MTIDTTVRNGLISNKRDLFDSCRQMTFVAGNADMGTIEFERGHRLMIEFGRDPVVGRVAERTVGS